MATHCQWLIKIFWAATAREFKSRVPSPFVNRGLAPGLPRMGNGPFWGSISLCFLCPWDFWFWTRHTPSHHVIFLICRGKTQCPLIPLVKLTGAPGSYPVTISLQQSLVGGEPGRDMAAHLEHKTWVLSVLWAFRQLVQLIYFNTGRTSRTSGKPWNQFENRNTTGFLEMSVNKM
jgi:hypothetical protein